MPDPKVYTLREEDLPEVEASAQTVIDEFVRIYRTRRDSGTSREELFIRFVQENLTPPPGFEDDVLNVLVGNTVIMTIAMIMIAEARSNEDPADQA